MNHLMAEELAKLVKNNYHSKCLIMSVENLLVDHLEGDKSPDGVLELKPMGSYDRMLVHRLADVFGVDHYSVGEGEDRHLVLKRSPETLIPHHLVSDLLEWEAEKRSRKKVKKLVSERVEELASLVKHDDTRRELILSVEDRLVKYLEEDAEEDDAEEDPSSDEILELEPMDSYNRMLVHRLAEIFGFDHHSVGEGEDRHLVLERTPETSNPGILVSDFLEQYDEMQSPMTYEEWQKEVIPDKGTKYELTSSHTKECGQIAVEDVIEYKESGHKMETKFPSGKNSRACTMSEVNKFGETGVMDSSSKEAQQKNNLKEGDSLAELKNDTSDKHLRQEQVGAAKRLFADVLGEHGKDAKISKIHDTEETDSWLRLRL